MPSSVVTCSYMYKLATCYWSQMHTTTDPAPKAVLYMCRHVRGYRYCSQHKTNSKHGREKQRSVDLEQGSLPHCMEEEVDKAQRLIPQPSNNHIGVLMCTHIAGNYTRLLN